MFVLKFLMNVRNLKFRKFQFKVKLYIW